MALKKLLKSILSVNCIKILDCDINQSSNELFIYVEATKGQRHRCPICGKKCSGYDTTTKKRTWRSLDFGSCKVYLVSDVHRIRCKVHGVHTERVPWAYHDSVFTKEFEKQVAYLALHLTKTDVTELLRINWRTVGSILTRTRDRIEPDPTVRFNNLKRIGIDETSYRKGHKYITVIINHDTNEIIWAAKGTGTEVLSSFFAQLTKEQRESIELVSADGAKWIKTCIENWLPNAKRCIDGFHVVSWASRSRLTPFVELSRKIRRHKEAIIATVTYGLSNSRIEAMNNKIKILIRKSYGFRNIENMIDMIMITCSHLYVDIKLPHQLRCTTHT